jgi:hypothetical protein
MFGCVSMNSPTRGSSVKPWVPCIVQCGVTLEGHQDAQPYARVFGQHDACQEDGHGCRTSLLLQKILSLSAGS